MLDKIQHKFEQKVKKLADTTQTAAVEILKDKVPEHVRQERWNICQGCEKLYVPTSTCKLCGCFMQVKTWMPDQKCPVDKWARYVIPNTEQK